VVREPCEKCDDTTDTYVGSRSLGLDGYYCRKCLAGLVAGARTDGGFALVLPEDARRSLLAFPALQAAATLWLRTARRDAIRHRISGGDTRTEVAREMGITRSAVRKAADADGWTCSPKVRTRSDVGATRRTA